MPTAAVARWFSQGAEKVSIVVEDFHKNYERTVAVAGITFSVAPGEILGLVGPNGAGKTTTLRALAGILRPTRGRLAISGYDLAREPVAAKSVLAYVPDDPRLFDQLTIWEHFRFIAAAYRLRDWTDRARAHSFRYLFAPTARGRALAAWKFTLAPAAKRLWSRLHGR